MTVEKAIKVQDNIVNDISEEIIRRYKILDEKCNEALKRIKKRKLSK